jgi:predicted N-acyltransferase
MEASAGTAVYLFAVLYVYTSSMDNSVFYSCWAEMEASAGTAVYPVHRCKTIYLVLHFHDYRWATCTNDGKIVPLINF